MARTQKERRADSDSRILESAIKLFGKNGYTYSTINAIAKDAGVTGGLVMQRYESKENLYVKAYELVIARMESFATPEFRELLSDKKDVAAVLTDLVSQVKEFRSTCENEFMFMKTHLNSVDFPVAYFYKIKNTELGQLLYDAVAEAQKVGSILEADTFTLIHAFQMHTFTTIDICYRCGIEYPDDRYFLHEVQYRDIEEEKLLKRNNAMLQALCYSFDGFIYVWVDQNRAEITKKLDDAKRMAVIEDVRKEIVIFATDKVADKDRDKYLAFMDIDSITERMGKRRVLMTAVELKDGRRLGHSLFPISYNENGKISELLYGIHLLRMPD